MNWRVDVRIRLGSLELDIDISGHEHPVVVIGPNGSGKTTVLRTIAGAHRPEVGRIHIGDHVLFDSERGIDLLPEERRVGYVPQGYGLFPHLTVVENVAFGRTFTTPRLAQVTLGQRVEELLAEMECGHLAARRPQELSGGEQQRVALARALMIDPGILLLDEPLAALDAPARRRLRSHLATYLADRGEPAIVATHDVRDVIALGADVYALEGGRVVQHGPAAALAAAPATEFIAEFFDARIPED